MSTTDSWPGEAPAPDEPLEHDELADEPAPDTEPDEPEHEPDEDTDGGGDDEPELQPAAARDELRIPDDIDVLEGEPRSTRRTVGVVVSREDTEVANRLLEAALAELELIGVHRDHLLVMPVPGPFELPIGAMALAKTRRYACIVALGSATASAVVAGEAASGLQLAGLETGVPISFGVLTDGEADAEGAAAAAVRNALEMADLFQHLRASAQPAK